MKKVIKIKSIEKYLEYIDKNISSWEKPRVIWFRGQPIDKELTPKLYRQYKYDEDAMIQRFSRNAISLGETPSSDELDEWLFLMQHYGLPTRLLDWTESSLIALYFALDLNNVEETDRNPIVWILNPLELNSVSIKRKNIQLSSDEKINYLLVKLFGFDLGEQIFELPIAVASSHIDRRMSAQTNSC